MNTSETTFLFGLLIDQSAENFASKKIYTNVPIVRPSKRGFIRAKKQAYGPFGLITEPGTNENFLIGQQLFGAALNTQSVALFHICIDRMSELLLIAEKLPQNGRTNPWNQSLRNGLDQAKTRWVSIVANTAIGQYECHVSTGNLPEPQWPEDLSDERILEIAFRDRIIADVNHTVLRKIRGEI